MTIYNILLTYYPAFLDGLYVTLKICLIVWFLGIIIGFPLGYYSHKDKSLGKFIWICNFLLMSIPSLVFLMWLHYPAQAIFDLVIDPFYTATLTFAVLNIFSISEIFRNSLDKFPTHYILQGKVSGLTELEISTKIIFPIVFRDILPSLLTLQVNVLHISLFSSFIAVGEIFRAVQTVNAKIYHPIELYTLLALFFIVVCAPINYLAIYLKKKYEILISEK